MSAAERSAVERLVVRNRLVLLAATTSLVLGGSVVTADSAAARRNVGGTVPADSACIKPGVVQLADRPFSSTPCVCYVDAAGRFHNLGRGDCPAGIPEAKIDRRNVGG